MSSAYLLGMLHCKMNYSIFYNPFRHSGSAQEYIDWEDGWKLKERTKN